MKCPYCAEEINENAIKCKHCGEWLPNVSYFYPSNSTNHGNSVIVKIEGNAINIERAQNGDIRIINGNEIIKEIPKDESSKLHTIPIFDHKLTIQYKSLPSIFNMLLWNSGFKIYVDGRPVKGTSADPQEKIKTASNAFFLFAAITFFNIFINPDVDAKIVAIFFFLIFIIFGFLTKKITILTTFLGSIYGILDVVFYIIHTFKSDYSSNHTGWFIFWLLIRTGATLALIQGFFAGIQLKSLKKKFANKINFL